MGCVCCPSLYFDPFVAKTVLANEKAKNTKCGVKNRKRYTRTKLFIQLNVQYDEYQ